MGDTKILKNINGLKAIVVLFIFFQHNGFWVNHLSQRGCDMLFMLSGFLIAYHYWHTSTEEVGAFTYGYKKFLQVYPLHLLCFLSSALFLYQWDAIPIERSIIFAALNVTLTQAWFNLEGCVYSFNVVSWFLSAIMVVYMLAPTVLRILKKLKKNLYFPLLLCIFGMRFLFELVSGIFNLNIFCNPIFSVLSAISGMLIYPLANHPKVLACLEKKNKDGALAFFLWSAAEVIPLLCLCVCTVRYQAQWRTTYFIMIIWVFLFFFSFNAGILSKLFSLPLWNFIARIQFEFFMFHQVVIRLLRPYLQPVVLLGASFMITCLLSYSYRNCLSIRLTTQLKKMCEGIRKAVFIS